MSATLSTERVRGQAIGALTGELVRLTWAAPQRSGDVSGRLNEVEVQQS